MPCLPAPPPRALAEPPRDGSQEWVKWLNAEYKKKGRKKKTAAAIIEILRGAYAEYSNSEKSAGGTFASQLRVVGEEANDPYRAGKKRDRDATPLERLNILLSLLTHADPKVRDEAVRAVRVAEARCGDVS